MRVVDIVDRGKNFERGVIDQTGLDWSSTRREYVPSGAFAATRDVSGCLQYCARRQADDDDARRRKRSTIINRRFKYRDVDKPRCSRGVVQIRT